MANRWNWKSWQKIVAEQVTDADALKLAEVWPIFAKQSQKGKRGMWAHEMTYKDYGGLPGWEMSRVMKAANRLEEVGLNSRCPGTPLYVPTMPETAGAVE